MPRVRKFERATVDLGGYGLKCEVTGFHVDLDEGIQWHAYYWTAEPAPVPVRVVFCKPRAAGFWDVIWRFEPGQPDTPIHSHWKPDNEDWFFFVEYRNASGTWVPTRGDHPFAGGEREAANNGNSALVWWNSPSKSVLKLLAL